jgi:hypothetical protein
LSCGESDSNAIAAEWREEKVLSSDGLFVKTILNPANLAKSFSEIIPFDVSNFGKMNTDKSEQEK